MKLISISISVLSSFELFHACAIFFFCNEINGRDVWPRVSLRVVCDRNLFAFFSVTDVVHIKGDNVRNNISATITTHCSSH